MAPIVLFRADATPQIGGGHIMRCLALAQRLGTVGAKCIFLVNPEAAHIAPALARSPHDIVSVGGADDAVAKARAAAPTGASLVIVDHYGVTATDETAFRQVAPNILVIDDLVDKPHDCDVLLNQNVNATRAGYAKLLPRDCRRLLGPRYALLRPEFAAARRASLAKRRQWDGRVRRVLLFLGLTDVGGFTAPLAELLLTAVPDLERLDLVVGATAPSIARIEDMAVRDPRLSVTVSADDMASRMLAADVAVGAVGSTSWERAALGLPTLGIVLADNQAPVAAALADAGALILLGDVRHTPLDHVGGRLRTAMNDPTALRELSLHASKVCDGRGVDRVISEIEKLIAAGRTVPSLPPSRPR